MTSRDVNVAMEINDAVNNGQLISKLLKWMFEGDEAFGISSVEFAQRKTISRIEIV